MLKLGFRGLWVGEQGPRRRMLAALLVRDGGSSDWGVSSGYGKK